jgi:integrase
MPKRAKELPALAVKNLRYKPNVAKDGGYLPCLHAVGGVGGLYLQMTPSEEGKSWVLRTVIGTKRRGIGLGPYPEIGLAKARELAAEMKEKIRNGVDPVKERKDARAALAAEQRRGLVFKKALDQYSEAKLGEMSSQKHRDLWMNSMRTYVLPYLGELMVSDIGTEAVRLCLMQDTDKGPFWEGKTETARRVRGRIENILDWATVKGHREGDNPARWKGNLKELLGNPRKIAKSENQPALQDKDAARWFAELQKREGNGSRALEFLTLTAARSGEVRGARWDEIDFERGLWVITALRMKMDREHRVPLSDAAVKLLKSLPMEGNSLLFPSARGGQLSDATLSAAMKRMHATNELGYCDRVNKKPAVPHGLRSTFRDWAAEHTHFAGEMIEIALAHKVANSVEAAYRRGDQLEKRRALMDAWADFLQGKQTDSKVVQFRG